MGNFREYLKMKEEGTVKAKASDNGLILEITQFNPRTGEKMPSLIQNLTVEHLDRQLENIDSQKKAAKDRYDDQVIEFNKQIKNINVLKKDVGLK